MSALSEAVPLALAAAFSPPAILVVILLLTGDHPRRLVFAYLAGAALVVGIVGVGGLFMLTATGATQQDSNSASASLDLALGIVLLLLAAWAWRRRLRRAPESDEDTEDGRLKRISHRATASVKWAFALGLLMYLPVPLYFAAIKSVADSASSTASQLLAVLICAICVLLFVEIPAIALVVRPDGLKASLERLSGWLSANSWTLLAVLAAAAGVWLLASGASALT